MPDAISPVAQTSYKDLVDKLAVLHDKAGLNQGVQAPDIESVREALDAYSKSAGSKADPAMVTKAKETLAALDQIVGENKTDGSNNAQWTQDINEIDELVRSVYPEGLDPAAVMTKQPKMGGLHDDFNSTVMTNLSTDKGKRFSATELKGLRDFVSANQANLSTEFTAQAKSVLDRAANADASQRPALQDVSNLTINPIGSKNLIDIGPTGAGPVSPLSAADKASLPGSLAGDTNPVVKLNSNPPAFIEESGPNYTLFDASGKQLEQFNRNENAVIGLNNGSWLQLAPTGLANSSMLPDVNKITNVSLSNVRTLKKDGTGTEKFDFAASPPAPAAAATGQAKDGAAGSPLTTSGPDRVTPGGTDRVDGFTYVTVNEGGATDGPSNLQSAGARTYVNYSKGNDSSGEKSSLWVNQGPKNPVDIVGPDPSKGGNATDGAVFLPDGSVAIKAKGAGFVLSGSTVTNIESGTKADASAFFANNPNAVPKSESSSFAASYGLPSAAAQETMQRMGVTVGGYGASTTAMPKNVFDAAGRNQDGARQWIGVGSAEGGQTYVQYDKDSKELLASGSSKLDSKFNVEGKDPANSDANGALFLPDGSVAFKHNGDAYVESGGTVVSVTNPASRQSAVEFFDANPGAVPKSDSAAYSSITANKAPNAAQAAAMQKYKVSVGAGTTSSAGGTSSANFAPEAIVMGTRSVPGGGVNALNEGDANFKAMADWPDVKGLVDKNKVLSPVTKKGPDNQGQDNWSNTDEHGDPTLANEGWQVFSIPGAQTTIMYNHAREADQSIHAFDTTTGKEIPVPSFSKSPDLPDGQSGSVVFADGTRMDIKRQDGDQVNQSGITLVSGDQVTTSDNRVNPAAAVGKAVSVKDPEAAKSYLTNNRLNVVNTVVQTNASGGGQTFAYSNNYTPDGASAWGFAGDGSYGGVSQPSLSWLNDPESTQNPAVTAALFPAEDYAPKTDDAQKGWTTKQLGDPPLTYDQTQKRNLDTAGTVFSFFAGGAGGGALLGGLAKLAGAAKNAAQGTVRLLGQPAVRKAPDATKPPPPPYENPPAYPRLSGGSGRGDREDLDPVPGYTAAPSAGEKTLSGAAGAGARTPIGNPFRDATLARAETALGTTDAKGLKSAAAKISDEDLAIMRKIPSGPQAKDDMLVFARNVTGSKSSDPAELKGLLKQKSDAFKDSIKTLDRSTPDDLAAVNRAESLSRELDSIVAWIA